MDPVRDWRALTVHYSDEMEYDVRHCAYNNDIPGRPGSEGRMLADLDNTYDRESVAVFHPLRGGASGSATNSTSSSTRQRSGTKDDAPSSKQQSRKSAPSTNRYDNTLSWPASIDQFRVGDRVDALDHKGTWFSGSVVDVFAISEADIQQCGLAKHSREAVVAKEPSTRARSSSGSTPTAKQRLAAGVHVRIHFDNFSFIWDEWYDQRDYERGMHKSIIIMTLVTDARFFHRFVAQLRRVHLSSVQQGAAQAQDIRPAGGAAATRARGQPRTVLAHGGWQQDRCGPASRGGQ